jgi:hypothetical protein
LRRAFSHCRRRTFFLQVKQAQRSVLERVDRKAAYSGNQGRRVVEGQRKMQAASDVFLGFSHDAVSRRDFYVRTLKNRRLDGIGEIAELEALSEYSVLCGKTLARAHARSGEPSEIAGYMGRSDAMDRAIASFAIAYADRTMVDHSENWFGLAGTRTRGENAQAEGNTGLSFAAAGEWTTGGAAIKSYPYRPQDRCFDAHSSME